MIKKPASTLYKDFASYIYNTGYQWNEGTQTWNKFTYNCTGVNIGGVWCDADAWATPDASHPYFVAYTCSKTNNVWNCGCTDQGCAQSNWQLQQFKP